MSAGGQSTAAHSHKSTTFPASQPTHSMWYHLSHLMSSLGCTGYTRMQCVRAQVTPQLQPCRHILAALLMHKQARLRRNPDSSLGRWLLLLGWCGVPLGLQGMMQCSRCCHSLSSKWADPLVATASLLAVADAVRRVYLAWPCRLRCTLSADCHASLHRGTLTSLCIGWESDHGDHPHARHCGHARARHTHHDAEPPLARRKAAALLGVCGCVDRSPLHQLRLRRRRA